MQRGPLNVLKRVAYLCRYRPVRSRLWGGLTAQRDAWANRIVRVGKS